MGNKKATIELSANFVVKVIVILVIFILILVSILGMFGKISFRFSSKIDEFALPPTAVISSPRPSDTYNVFDTVYFDSRESYDRYSKIVGYFWDIDGDSIIDKRAESFRDYYYEPGEYNLTLKVVNDAGKIGVVDQVVNIYTRNKKIEDLEKSMFLIRDNNKANEKDVLRLMPVTTWNDINGLHSISYYVYYFKDASSSLTEVKLKEIMAKYGKEHAYVFDDSYIPCCDFDWGNITKIDNIDEVYFNFWELYESVVLVDPEMKDASLIASLFAAFYNSPIIFVDSSNLNMYKNAILNDGNTKNVYYIPSAGSIDESVHGFIAENNLAWIAYPVETLRDPSRRVNRIVKITSNVTMS